jgi:hypothetical protein
MPAVVAGFGLVVGLGIRAFSGKVAFGFPSENATNEKN